MLWTVMRLAALSAVVCITTQGCAALLLGYIVGSEIDKSKAVEQCRANMTTVNNARIARREEPFPDQCSR
jgi:hypothetical protein